ncbi:DUF5333 domain-containing protein [Sulfitobacter sp. D35]|uniref:DUF5333 domain-containing protein n=1 Tax=Sulfitobacter sp. D35 TaxID=3083252 RepID=UPI00296FF5FC|nr:DUF5333 domain-containing protein [Sulfitobacter sp. D35]MDW4496889.1 DUF5333 domain-containing protein [Sulfitobacter sp. D35]
MRALMMTMVALSLAATPLAAKPHLRDVAEIDDGLLWIGIANEIRKTCPDISARMVRAYSRIKGLESRALQLGYTEGEIQAYVRSDAEKERMKKRGYSWLKSKGVAVGDVQGYCALGKAEIDRNSSIGSLLRAN